MVKSNDLSTSSTNKPLNTICGRSDQSRRPSNLANTQIAAKEIVSAHTRKIPYQDNRSTSLLFASTRSILDTSTSSVSDDEESDGAETIRSIYQDQDRIWIDKFKSFGTKDLHTPPLNLNLPTRIPLSGFPDEQDRKRIVGCLAAVLATSYWYDTAENGTSAKFEDENDENDKIIDSAVDDSSLFKHGSYEETAAKDNKNNFPSMYGAVAPLDMNEKLLDANQICNI
mmetsp:Transcript_24898/g.30592  ORF Transcript_24898/g.30592 Transcript_24898/m.30592 type:complete len:227 (-) Transcript_24898:1043-1723(-)